VYPSSHSELCNEDVAAFSKQDWGFGGNHLDFGIRLHDLFYPRERQLMQLEIVFLGLELSYLILPVHIQDVLGRALQALGYLRHVSLASAARWTGNANATAVVVLRWPIVQ
jgi:hypothetical protein